MPARENQGLQIALIVFVILTIGMVVSTYMFFSRYTEQVERNKKAVADASEAASAKDKVAKDKADLMAFIGAVDPATPVADVIAAERTKFAPFTSAQTAQLPADQQTVDKLFVSLVDARRSADLTTEQTKLTSQKEVAQVKQDLAKAQADATEVTNARTAAEAALADQTKKYNDAVADLQKTKDQLAQEKNDLSKAADADKAKLQVEIATLGGKIAVLAKENTALKALVDTFNRPNPEVSGGKIVFVNQRDNTVMLDIGSDDALQRRTTFNVYPVGTANVTNITPKGRVEVTSIVGPHSSEARIIENAISNPLLPGDLVHSVEWAPGRGPHYAIGGPVDLNGSGTDQTQRLREMIESTGGVVDAYLDDYKDSDNRLSARVKGAITINTRYLILGDPKIDTPEGQARLQPTTTLITEADRLHVEKIGLNKFLTMMGYVAPIGVGPGAAGTTPKGTIKGGENNVFQDSFRPRQPGAATAPAPSTSP